MLRIGYSLLGITNHPATAEATGLEVDKLNAAYREELHGQISGQLQGTVGAELMGRRGIRYVDHRQLGGGFAELDRRHDRQIQDAARL